MLIDTYYMKGTFCKHFTVLNLLNAQSSFHFIDDENDAQSA